jgi:predicted Zn finger-like uncharacterized protein
MSIVTKCPSCGTTFRVTPQQLQAQHGMVRCGRCASVFDGFKTLATLTDLTPPEVAPTVASRDDMPMVAEATPGPEEVRIEPADEAPAALPLQESAPAVLPDDVATPEPVTMVQTAAIAPEPLPFAPAAIINPAPRRHAGGWAFGVLILLAGLAAQGVYLYRSEIAASVPEARPYLRKMCDLLRCTVALPQQPRQISIEASDLQATDPANPGVIALTATLRNQATIELGYPALDVVLTNTKEHTVARRIFLPGEYLAAGKDPRTGIAPNAEITVRLDLDTGDLGAAGFRLDVLAAPAR